MKNYFKILVTISISLLIISCAESKKQKVNVTESTIVKEEKIEIEKPIELWTYSQDEDEMDGSINYFASVTSNNEVNFEFPYAGGSTLSIFIRNMNNNTDVVLVISKGQFLGTIMGDEHIRVKFDDEKPVNYNFSGSDNGNSETIFPSKIKTFITKTKKAKKIMIEAPFYDSGRKVFYFDVEGLQWDK